MRDSKKHVAGVDIAKAELVVQLSSDGQTRRFDNDAAGIRKFVQLCRKSEVTLVVCEHTGRHEWALLLALWDEQIPVHCAHPKAVSNFGKALKANAKSDPIDAGILVEYGMRMDLEPSLPPPQELIQLRELTGRREDLNQMLVQEKNRAGAPAISTGIRRAIRAHIRCLEKQLRDLEREVAQLVKASPALKPIINRLDEEYGVGLISAATIYASMPELGALSRETAAALAGVAPFIRNSGKFVGRAKIGGGRTQARTALYMVALTVIRKPSHPLTHLYRRLQQNGKHNSIALVAVMRKLIIRFNTILRELKKNTQLAVATA